MKGKWLKVLRMTIAGFLASIALSLVYYVIFSIFFSTDQEKELLRGNRILSEQLPELEYSAGLLRDEMQHLEAVDSRIYKKVFDADAPSLGLLVEGDVLYDAVRTGGNLVARADIQSDRAMDRSRKVESDWREIFAAFNEKGRALPPLSSPLANLSYTAVGASVGERMNPFYKLKVMHEGLDLVASPGTPVYAAAPGIVSDVKRSNGGRGNVVEITHPGGYVTRYAHMAEISVKRGKAVKTGAKIGLAGDSGRSFLTHLHYEVLWNGKVLDPVHCLFGSVTPDEYEKMLIMSVSSAQSMD